MSLSSTTNKVIFNGNGATIVWPFSFMVLEAGHLSVILTDASGLETTLPSGLYSVAGIGDPAGGSVTYPLTGSPVASGTRLTLLRTVPYTQTTVLSNQGGYYPEVVERRFDQIYMALQQLEERVGRASLYSLSNPATEQANHALIQPLQQMNCLTTQGDLLTRDATSHKRLPRGMAGQFLGVSGADLAWSVPSQPVAPQGRLTLSSGEPVMSANQAGKTSIFYTPYVGNNVPIYDGSSFVPTPFSERSNDLTQSVIGKAGPSVAGPYQCMDAFVWNDAGTVRLTRGPKWRRAGAFTITAATPAVVTWVGHGLSDGATWTPESTTGSLPAGGQVVLGTTYFITKVDNDSFKLSTTLANQVAGTFINTTGAQSGVHTGANYTSGRGAGAGTCELELLNGVLVNRYDIVNGPAARCATFVGTIYSNGASQVDFKMGGAAAGGSEAFVGVWNGYNRIDIGGSVIDTSASWVYNTAAWKAYGASATNRASMVSGLQEDDAHFASVSTIYDGTGGLTQATVAVGFNRLTPSGPYGMASSTTSLSLQHICGGATGKPFGLSYGQMLAYTATSTGGGSQFLGAASGGSYNSGQRYAWRY